MNIRFENMNDTTVEVIKSWDLCDSNGKSLDETQVNTLSKQILFFLYKKYGRFRLSIHI